MFDGSEFEPDKADMIQNGIEDVTDEIQKMSMRLSIFLLITKKPILKLRRKR